MNHLHFNNTWTFLRVSSKGVDEVVNRQLKPLEEREELQEIILFLSVEKGNADLSS
jgi:hypothetical protein